MQVFARSKICPDPCKRGLQLPNVVIEGKKFSKVETFIIRDQEKV